MAEAAGEVWFYHLEHSTLDQVLPELLEKTLARGWRALVRGTARERLEHLDAWLWTWREDSFLAHGLDGEGNEARQPVLLAGGHENPNQAEALFLIDGAEADDVSGFQRCMVIFDGGDDSALAAARAQWSAFKTAGRSVTYWRQKENRGWERQG